jgi:hypothetical protein
MLALGLLVSVTAVRAQQPATPAPESTGDQRLYAALKDVLNRGADLYNGGDFNGCYRLFEGALMVARFNLEHRPELQRGIDQGLAEAERQSALPRRAWLLRGVLGNIRTGIHPPSQAKGSETKAPEQTPPSGDAKPAPPPERKPDSLPPEPK